MAIIIGSARSDENGNISGGRVGDQTGREVSTQLFYMHSKGWYRLRPKNAEHAKKMAQAMKNACDNENFGYDQGNRAAVKIVKKYGSTKAVTEKTETDCSNLVRACILEATGEDVGEFYTGNEADVLEKSGLFEKRAEVKSSADVCDGDVLVTKTKGHTVIVTSGRARGAETQAPVKKEETPVGPSKTSKWTGKVAHCSKLNVRTNAGKAYPNIKSYPVLNRDNLVDVCDTVKDSSGNNWYYIKIADKFYGFVSASYIEKA